MTAPTTPHDNELWQKLQNYEIGPPDAPLTFADRLARENRWSPEHAEQVILDYKRFCYLARTAGHPVTPSDKVDQAWHLHLTYSRDYWQRFCPEVLGNDFHHGPTEGGQVERTRYYDQYARTLAAYEAAFGQAPDPAIWPPAKRRFQIDPKAVRVNPHDAIIVSKLRACWAIGAIVLLALAAGWLLRGVF